MATPATILVIDDNASLREALSTLLVPPFRVLTAGTGTAAKDVLLRDMVDLALIDYVLPDMSGLRLLEDLHRLRPELLIILMTAFGSEAVAVEAFRGGVWDYLTKPFSTAELLLRLSRALLVQPSPSPARSASDTERAPTDHVPELVGVPHPNIERAIRFVHLHLREDLTLAQVAHEAGMSKYHFCRVFRHQVGLTFREFVVSRRIGRATELLRDGHRSVTEICSEIGFKNLSHFGRVFRHLIGRPPSAYRRAVATADQCPRSETMRRPEKQESSNEKQPGRSKKLSPGIHS